MKNSNNAYLFAYEKHFNQKRSDGTEYINHPVRVAELVKKYKNSSDIDSLICAAFLHDIIEDTDTTYYEIVNLFGYKIASLVMELTTNDEMKKAIGKNKYMAYKLKHMTSWALVIKLCNRLDNVSDTTGFKAQRKKRYIEDTIFLINYLEKNRELSKTHKKIIKEIKKTLYILE